MKQYLELLEHVLKVGKRRPNRTGIDTISTFGYQNRYDISEGFPLLTTKRVGFKTVMRELLWFVKGDTNIRYLVKNKCYIWNEWPFKAYMQSLGHDVSTHEKIRELKAQYEKEFIDKIINDDEFAKQWGELGPVYGKQWRNFGGVDQLQEAINTIRTSPDSRRIIVCAWNPTEVKEMAKKGLPPCHSLFQFYVDTEEKTLSCELYQRSADSFLGVPFNIASYAALTYMVAAMCGLKPKEFVHTFGDLHVYVNHLEQVKLQLSRTPGKLPTLKINRIPEKIEDFTMEDFELIGYEPQEAIKGEVAV
ncbi:MAG: thymidylate synthase [Mycoplasmataceae bacterium]|nr:thymidylate synthase [Mycoplasmataceae bacterium]